ncbi:MAG: RNA polymerase sigma factor [bacterium]
MADDGGFAAWYEREHRRLVNVLVVAAGDVDAGVEVADEAFARCLERWDGPRRPEDPSAWTYRVAINLLRRRWRRRRRERSMAVRLNPPTMVDLPAPAVELWRAVARLPERARLAVVLRYVGGLTEREVAESMDVAPGTVAATLAKARRQLAARLEDPREAVDG